MKSFLEFIHADISEAHEVVTKMLADTELHTTALKIAELCIQSLKNNNTILFAGNGGSAADAQHLAGEFAGMMNYDRPPISAVPLTVNTSSLTAISNDYGYEQVFARQIESVGRAGDVFIGISTSGTSKNVVEALKVCKKIGVHTVGMTGETGGIMNDLCDICLKIPSKRTPKIQEGHIMFGHAICGIVEEVLYGEYNPKRKAVSTSVAKPQPNKLEVVAS